VLRCNSIVFLSFSPFSLKSRIIKKVFLKTAGFVHPLDGSRRLYSSDTGETAIFQVLGGRPNWCIGPETKKQQMS
jgi:hypothetical protein